MSMTPMSRRNDSARIFMVGCRSTNSPIDLAETSMTSTAITIAATMTGTTLAMPTAVITESREKTMSRMAIWMSVAM